MRSVLLASIATATALNLGLPSFRRPTPPITPVVLDADGTTLNPAHELTPNVAAAIAEARDAGLTVMFATGRAVRARRKNPPQPPKISP